LNIANALAAGSPHVTIGAMARQPLKIPNGLLIFQNLAFRGFWLRRWKENSPAAEIQSTYTTLADLLHRGILHTPLQQILPLSEAPAALTAAMQDKRTGKILLDLQA
jgi:trans-2-enoyl-CoA reductase